MSCANLQENRRQLLRRLISASAVAAIDASAQPVTSKGRLTEKLFAGKYLPEAYTMAAAALLAFDNLTAANKSEAARDALTRAAAIICDALAKLANDVQFWAALAEQHGPIGKNAAEINQLLNNLEQFIPEEEKAIQNYMPAGPRMRLVSSLSLALSRFRGDPTNWNLENLRARVNDSHDAVCAASKPPATEPRTDYFSDIRIVGHGLGVLGGAATILINAITTMALPVALTSVVAGVATIIGSSTSVAAEIKSRKR